MNKPKCAVRGMVSRGAMCGSVIVGGVYCGRKGECQHKVPVCVYCEGTGIDPESFRSPAELVCPACSVPDSAEVSGAGTASVGLPCYVPTMLRRKYGA